MEFVVEGMSCGSCVARIEKALKKVAGIESVRIDLGAGKASVEVGAQGPSADAISAAIADAGYESRPVAASKSS